MPHVLRQKVLAYVVRFDGGNLRIAAFDHVDAPEAGTQVPAGTIDAGESPEQACLREVIEESGIAGARIVRGVGVYDHVVRARAEVHRRHVFVVAAPDGLPDEWTHRVTGAGGDRDLVFRFRWLEPAEAAHRLAGEQGAYLAEAVMTPAFRLAPQTVTDPRRADQEVAARPFRSAQAGSAGPHSDWTWALSRAATGRETKDGWSRVRVRRTGCGIPTAGVRYGE